MSTKKEQSEAGKSKRPPRPRKPKVELPVIAAVVPQEAIDQLKQVVVNAVKEAPPVVVPTAPEVHVVAEIPTPPPETVEAKPELVVAKPVWWKKYWWVLALGAGILAGVIINAIQSRQINKGIKETQRTEATIATDKEQAQQTEANILRKRQEVDSSIYVKISELTTLLEVRRSYDSKQNEIHQKEHDEILDKLHDSTLTNDGRRELQRKLSEE
jgi:hypothetical protein